MMEVCRACLSSDKNMMPLNETFITSYNFLTNINIKPLDGLPQWACITCVYAVDYFMDFREKCIQSESSLQQQLLEDIKCEPEECDNSLEPQPSLEINCDIPSNKESSPTIQQSYEPEEGDIELNSPQLFSEKYCDSHPKKENLPKRPRGRPRKEVAASETPKRKGGRPRKNRTSVPEVQNTVSSLIQNFSDSAELSHSQCDQNHDLDLIEKEIKYEYTEIFDDNSNINSNLEAPAIEPNIFNSVPLNYIPNRSKLHEKMTPKQSKTTKNLVEKETDIPCGLCEKIFETQQLASSHLEEHKIDLKCETCHETFPNWQAFLAHRMKHVPKKYHRCHICLKRLQNMESLEYHYLLKHSDKKLQDIKLPCKLCTKTFPTPAKLKKHIRRAHSTNKYTCDHCDKTFSTRNSMIIHLQIHAEVKKYVCGTCGDRFKQNRTLKAHIMRKHTATRVYCLRCYRVYPNEEALQKHVCPQVEKMCPVCGKVFKRTTNLNRHLESHSDVRRHKCDQCPAAFRSRQRLQEHTNRHRGVRPHACPHCPKRFYSSCLLASHERIHTGVRPYVCKTCSRAFNSSYNLKFHMRVHGEYLVAHRDKT